MNIIHKLKIKLSKESLARARKRIRNDLKRSNLMLVYRNVFKDGTEGYLRDKIYNFGNKS